MITIKKLIEALEGITPIQADELLDDINKASWQHVGMDIELIIESQLEADSEGHESDTEYRDECDRDAKEAAR